MYKIKYRRVVFINEKLPICNLCNNSIDLTKHYEKNKKDKPYYKIVKCSNSGCVSNVTVLKNYDLYKAYLPIEIAEEEILSIKNNLKKNNRYCVENWLNKGYSEEEAKIKISQLQLENSLKVKHENRVKITKEFYKKKGLSEEEIYKKTLTPSKLDFWINKGYNEEEAKNKLVENQLYANSKVDKKSIIGNTKLEYWINKGYGEKEAKIKLKERQTTFSKRICIEKHGEKEGLKIWKKRQEKWNKSLNINGNMKIGYSKISQVLFDDIKKRYDKDDDIFYATNKGELKINRNDNNSFFLYDFTDKKSKKIIEYNGDMFHANPKIYESNDNPHPFRKKLTASQIWEKDNIKKKLAESHGFEIFYIWDSEVRRVSTEKYEEILNKCLIFLNLKE